MLATEVPSYSNGLIPPDGRSITFILRPRLRWSDGAPLTARDVNLGWQVAVQTWAEMCPAVCGVITGVTTSSPRRLTFHLRRPFGALMYDLPPVLPRHQIWKGSWTATRDYLFQPATDWMSPRFAVSGPFMVQSSSDTGVLLVRNPQWSILRRPGFSSVTVTTFPTDEALLNGVTNGSITLAQGFAITDIDKGIIAPKKLGANRLRFFPTGGIEHLEPNLLRSPLNDVRVRQALNLVIDRPALLQFSLGIPASATSDLVAYGPEMPGRFDGLAVSGVWDPIAGRFITPTTRNHGLRLAHARRLLTEAGWLSSPQERMKKCVRAASPCRLAVTMLIPKTYLERILSAQFLQTEWGRQNSGIGLGLRTILNFRQWSIGNLIAPFGENGPCAHGWFDFCMFAQLPGYDPQTDFQLEFGSGDIARYPKGHSPRLTDLNYPGVRDPVIDSILTRAGATFDIGKRRALYRRWQIRVAKRAYWIALYQQPLIVVERQDIREFHPSNQGAEWNPWALAPATTRR